MNGIRSFACDILCELFVSKKLNYVGASICQERNIMYIIAGGATTTTTNNINNDNMKKKN